MSLATLAQAVGWVEAWPGDRDESVFEVLLCLEEMELGPPLDVVQGVAG